MDQIGSKTRIIPVTTEEYYKNLGVDLKYVAKRPLNSRLSKDKLVNSGFALLPDWQSAVSRYLDELYLEKNGVQRKHIKGEK